jgi:hypothetical protein
MGDDELRELMHQKFTAMSQREWCRLTGCLHTHVSEFMRGKKGPPKDMLRALNLRVVYVRNRTKP